MLDAGLGTKSGIDVSNGWPRGETGRFSFIGIQWEARLRELLGDTQTPLHMVGVGNPLKGDDAVGIEIMSQLLRSTRRKRVGNVILHAPTALPERVLALIDCTEERVLVFDAVESGGPPGQVVLANLGESMFGYFATHNVPLKIIPGIAANPSNAYVSGIEPEELGVGRGLSDAVRASAERVTSVVESALGGGTDGLP